MPCRYERLGFRRRFANRSAALDQCHGFPPLWRHLIEPRHAYRIAQDDRGGNDDPQQISAGLNLGFAGFTVGGSIGVEDSDRAQDGVGWDAGATYSTGPWAVGVTYFHSEVEGAPGGGEDELDAAQAGVSYAVGPGITASANVLWAEWDGAGAGANADGLGAVFGMKMGF
jgi:predicted porin